MSELHHECGVAAIYHLPSNEPSPLWPDGREQVSRLLPRMLLDIQNRGQLAAGITSYNPGRDQLLLTHKDVGSVTEVFRLAHRNEAEKLMQGFLHLVKGEDASDLPEDDRERLEVMGGISEFPMRVKCATLAWHTYKNAVEEGAT